jgi:hypothetical protein
MRVSGRVVRLEGDLSMCFGKLYGTAFLSIVTMSPVACGREQKSDSSGLKAEQRVRKNQRSHENLVEHDKRVVRMANAAVNEVVRSMPDCEAIKAALPEAEREIERARKNVRTEAGLQMIEAMRHRIRPAQDLCP